MNAPLPRPGKRRTAPIKAADRSATTTRALERAMNRLAKSASERGLDDEKLDRILEQLRRRNR